MAKLRNAPLLEVIFELRWDMKVKSDWDKYQYLHGDLYSLLKDNFPVRELLVPSEAPPELFINNPVHRFRKSKGGYPLVQIGPGLITFNTTEQEYEWLDYFNQVCYLLKKFGEVLEFDEGSKIRPALCYYDFVKFDFEQDNIILFLKDNFNIKVEQEFHKSTSNPNFLDWTIGYEIEFGNLLVQINKGTNERSVQGLIIQTRISGSPQKPTSHELERWLDKAHAFCSNLFKEMTKGELYDSFN